VDDALVAGAVERDDCRNVTTAKREEVLCAAQVASPFLSGRGDELDRPHRAQSPTRDLLGQRQCDREPPSVVVDPRPDDPRAVAAHRERHVAREHRVEMRADDDGLGRAGGRPSPEHVAGVVDMDVAQAAGGEAARHPRAALTFLARRGSYLGKLDLGAHDVRVAPREPLARRSEGAKRLPGRHGAASPRRNDRQDVRRRCAGRGRWLVTHAYELRTGRE
jgi:hypothetical protein